MPCAAASNPDDRFGVGIFAVDIMIRYPRGHMPRKLKPEPDDPAQSKRFIDMAREVGADETEKGREAFERAFEKIKSEPPIKRKDRS